MDHHQPAGRRQLASVPEHRTVGRFLGLGGADDGKPFLGGQERIEVLGVEVVERRPDAGLAQNPDDLAGHGMVEAVWLGVGDHHRRRTDQPHLGSLKLAGRSVDQVPTSRLSPEAVTVFDGSGLGAGPAVTEPSLIEYLLPWHGQSMVPSAILLTRQPWWVQTLLNAL